MRPNPARRLFQKLCRPSTTLAALVLLITLSLVAAPTYAIAPKQAIQLLINDIPLALDVPPQVMSGRVMLPFRQILEAVGAEVTWDARSQTAFAYKPPVAMALKPDSRDAFINGIPVPLDAPVRFVSGRLLVPARFVSERLGAQVIWDAADRQVRIYLDRSPQETPPSALEPATPQDNASTTGLQLRLGTTVQELVGHWGQPKDILLNQYGFYWYVYHNDYQSMELVGVRGQQVVARYTQSTLTFSGKSLAPGQSKQTVKQLLGQPLTTIEKDNMSLLYDEPDIDRFKRDGDYIAVFYDALDDNRVRSLLWIKGKEELQLDGYYGQLSESVLRNHEYLMFLLVNGSRVQIGIAPLAWAPEVIESARAHSVDMAKRGYFNHISPEGIAPYQRLEATGIPFRATAENLAAGQFDAIHAHEALMNSPGHRRNILSADMTRLGVGIATGGNYSIYYTCTYYTPQ